MGHKLVVGPINRGLQKDRTAFVIDNDAFPALINSYQWRGRIKRKRGTSFLNRLTQAGVSVTGLSLTSGEINLISALSLESTAQIKPGSINIQGVTDGTTYTDPDQDGTLTAVGGTGTGGTVNYSTGDITIDSGAGQSITGTFSYYPGLPVMGLESYASSSAFYPLMIAMDTSYAYTISNSSPYTCYNINFYKNPASATYTGYTAKSTWTNFNFNGQSYQQFWTTNYQGALWATNGVTVPFSGTNIGMQYKQIITVDNITGGPPATADLSITGHGLTVGDFVFINEVLTTTGINFQTGYVISVVSADKVTVEFPNATIATNGTGGIAQYLTRKADPTKDGIMWYDGNPTDGASPPVPSTTKGWVNFAPPLSYASYSIGDVPASTYYLVGAKLIVPFKDHLLFFGPVIQTSSSNSQIYLQDTIIWSQNGTPYYTCSFTGNPTLSTTTFNSILVPVNQTATANSFFEDQSGYGGYLDTGIDQPITTVSTNQDLLIVGYPGIQSKLAYTGNTLLPFSLYLISTEYGSTSTFSAINMDTGVIAKGTRGYTLTSQVSSQRIDLPIPDEVFETDLGNNGSERICAQRDFLQEWVYFTYNMKSTTSFFPTRTLQYNYRDNSWALFYETYTTYGLFQKASGYTWSTIGSVFPTWSSWNESWISGSTTLYNQQVIGGNQQGFVITREEGTAESDSLYIQSISGSVITCPDHCLSTGDYIFITSAIGTISSEINDKIFSVQSVTQNTFTLNPSIGSGTYLGLGVIKKLYIPFIQSKQFPLAWDLGRKTRLGVQQYLLTKTAQGQVTLNIYLSQDGDNPYNDGAIVPSQNSENDSLVYSSILYTCPEGTNLGLTPANINLNSVTAVYQEQIWHRINTSLLGDTVQIGITLSDSQMRELGDNSYPTNAFSEIELHAFIIDCSPSQLLI